MVGRHTVVYSTVRDKSQFRVPNGPKWFDRHIKQISTAVFKKMQLLLRQTNECCPHIQFHFIQMVIGCVHHMFIIIIRMDNENVVRKATCVGLVEP
jgi:hypothetical protein